MDISLYRLESYEFAEEGNTNERKVICSFETNRYGYLQIGFDEGGLFQLKNEPDVYSLSDNERKYITSVCAIAWRMVFETGGYYERFK